MSFRHLLLGIWSASACAAIGACGGEPNGAPALVAMEPSEVSALAATPARLVGRNLYAAPTVQLDNNEPPDLRRTWTVRLGSVSLPAESVQWRDPSAIDLIVPQGLPAQNYDVTVITPTGVTLRLPDGLKVVDEPVGLQLSVEDAPGGTGTTIADRQLTAGDELTAYAVLRQGGEFIADHPASWSLQGGVGTVPAGPSTSATMTATTVGAGRLLASDPVADDGASGLLTVTAGPAVRLAIEDTADGGGAPVGNRQLTTDDELALHAIARDGFDNFVTAEPVQWTVTGSIGTIAGGTSSSATFDPTTPGAGTITIAHATLPAASTGTITVSAGRAATLTVAPATATLTTDDEPLQFTATATDTDGNPTSNTGAISWNIANGPIATIDPSSGLLTPTIAGVGVIRASSSLGISAASDTITVEPGRAVSFHVSPDTATTWLPDGPDVLFGLVDAVDSHDNATADLGTITWSIASGPITAIDTDSGRLTPITSGVGQVRATSSYGFDAQSSTIRVAELPLVVTAIQAAETVQRGERNVRVELTVRNDTGDTAELVTSELRFRHATTAVDDNYTSSLHYRNPTHIPSNQAATVTLFVTVAETATLGDIEIAALTYAYLPALSLFATASTTAEWTVGDEPVPTAVISSPLPPNNRLCTSQSVDFVGSDSNNADNYLWTLPGGNPATSAEADPTEVSYATLGNHPFWLTVQAETGARDTALGPVPLFVGVPAAPPHPTGFIRFLAPADGASADLSELPLIGMDSDDPETAVRACNGAPLGDGSNDAYVTLFVDRGSIDPSIDIDPAQPGVQVPLDQGSHFSGASWLPLSPMTEGETLVYAEFRKQPEGVVTAAGWSAVTTINDAEPPTIAQTLPAADCTGPCYGIGHRWFITFSEPMDATAAVAATTVEFAAAANCAAGSFGDITAQSTVSYAPATRSLEIVPALQTNNNYSVRITVATTATDASSNSNPLSTAFTRCAVMEARNTFIPARPALASPPAPLSPDGDGIGDTATAEVVVGSNTAALRIDIYRGTALVYARLQPVVAAGSYDVTWDGRDGTGRVVPDGAYQLQITAHNAVGVPSPPLEAVIRVATAVSRAGVSPWL